MNEPDRTTVRRAPRYGAFMIVGGMAGLVATLVLTSLQPVDQSVGFAALFGYFALFGVPAGIALGAGVAILLDAISRKRAKSVEVEVETVEAPGSGTG